MAAKLDLLLKMKFQAMQKRAHRNQAIVAIADWRVKLVLALRPELLQIE